MLDHVLAAVSRSFYLTIRALPPVLREPVGLAYLLARASDTVADSAGASVAVRLQALHEMGEALHGRAPGPALDAFAPEVPDPSERVLLERAGELWALLEAAAPADRAEIVRVLDEILRGQCLDLQRFPSTPADGGVTALATAGELEDYTYRVAGCVGEFWTRICLLHLPRYAPGTSPERLCEWGISFGKGLQLVNILRDAPADLANGRCYLPANELECEPAELRARPECAHPACDRWMARAREHLADGLRYIEAIRPWRLRWACFLPWALGIETLNLMERSRPLETPRRVKVPRGEVRRLLAWGVVGALGNGGLRRAAARVKRQQL